MIVRVLLAEGVHIKGADDIRITPLTSAASQGHVEVAKVLLEMVPTSMKWTVVATHHRILILAASGGYIEVAKLLLKVDPKNYLDRALSRAAQGRDY